MKKFVSFALALMVMLSVCASSFATTHCDGWKDVEVRPAVCTSGGCGLASWMSVMKGIKQQVRPCHDDSNSWVEYQWIHYYGPCC